MFYYNDLQRLDSYVNKLNSIYLLVQLFVNKAFYNLSQVDINITPSICFLKNSCFKIIFFKFFWVIKLKSFICSRYQIENMLVTFGLQIILK